MPWEPEARLFSIHFEGGGDRQEIVRVLLVWRASRHPIFDDLDIFLLTLVTSMIFFDISVLLKRIEPLEYPLVLLGFCVTPRFGLLGAFEILNLRAYERRIAPGIPFHRWVPMSLRYEIGLQTRKVCRGLMKECRTIHLVFLAAGPSDYRVELVLRHSLPRKVEGV